MAVDPILSVDQLLANAKAGAARKSSTNGLSAVGKLLADREESPTANLTPVQRLLYEQANSGPPKQELYTEQEWYIRAKVSQLRGQIALYTNLPGLDPGGAIMEGLTKEVTDLVQKQADTIKEATAEADAKQAELDKKQAAEFQGLSAEEMLERATASVAGTDVPLFNLSSEDRDKNAAVDALLKKVGATVSTSA